MTKTTDENEIARDGEVLRVPFTMMDGVPVPAAAPTRDTLYKARDIHLPDRLPVETAWAVGQKKITEAWRNR